jgi:hypothetical protein
VKESACQFGPQRLLAGILTEPTGPARSVAVVLVTAGFTPKFGPFRLYAELARHLAESARLRTLRFDLGGIGDSGATHAGLSLAERTRHQIGDAIDYLSGRFELDGVILAGLCSGADDSFRHAEQDSRVTGVVMIDPFAYRTPGFAWRHLKYRAKRRLLRALGLYRRGPASGDSLVDYEHLPEPEARRVLCGLLKRRVLVHFVYTGGMREHFNHRGQLRAMFRGIALNDRVTLDYLPQIDHTQLMSADRRVLIEAIAGRLAG